MLKLKRFDEGAWHDYAPGVRFQIKPLSRVDSLQIRLKCKRKLAVQGGDGISIVDDIDMREVTYESFKKALMGWQGPLIDGVEKPQRMQMIDALFEDDKVVDFVLDVAFKSIDAEEAKLEQELKNSESSQDGSSSSKSST